MTKWKLYESPYTKCIGIGYQVKDIEEAYNELRTIGADVLASIDEHPDSATQAMYESTYQTNE